MAQPTEVTPGKRKNPGRELLETAILALLIALAIRAYVIEVYQVRGSSMEATLHDQDRVMVAKFLYRWVRPPRPGDIIVFQYPREPERDFIKRIVAVAGDTVELRAGKVYVNGELFVEAASAVSSHDTVAPHKVPPDTVWVLGDNRSNSTDSRTFGEVPLENIRGLAFMRVWPPARICRFVSPTQAAGAARGVLTCP